MDIRKIPNLKMTNDKAQMSNQAQNPNDKKEYDLEERTARFGEAIIEFVKTLSRDSINHLMNELPLGLFKSSAHLMTELSYLGFYLKNKFNF